VLLKEFPAKVNEKAEEVQPQRGTKDTKQFTRIDGALTFLRADFGVLLLNVYDKKTCYFAAKVYWHIACSTGRSFAQ